MRDFLSRQKCTKNIIQLLSKRAQDYIVSYHLLTHKNDDVKDSVMKCEKDDDPVVVKVESRYSHPIYSKTMIKTRKYLAHDDLGECNIGDQVLVEECRPLSKRKRWIVAKILSKSSLIT